MGGTVRGDTVKEGCGLRYGCHFFESRVHELRPRSNSKLFLKFIVCDVCRFRNLSSIITDKNEAKNTAASPIASND